MDSLSIISLVALAVSAVIIIIYAYINKKTNTRKYFTVIQEFAVTSGCTVTTYDRWDKTMIGLGNGQQETLLFMRTVNGEESRVAVPLTDVMDCRLVKEERNVQYGGEKINMIDRITLVLTFRDERRPRLVLEFYNNEYDHLTISVELLMAKKWADVVKEAVAKGRESKKGVAGIAQGGQPGTGPAPKEKNPDRSSKPLSGRGEKVKQASPAA